eukprot:TRINITY_DN21421_c0_g1_i1.p1 TRINITY_DN21421_c0_g1~~TRINITY_DN21421_c0_g1_i1.p1  ORF type:complete len:638 (+),score=207.94 TRINITY_DN21421_c0_g1_i1:55-1968(+)
MSRWAGLLLAATSVAGGQLQSGGALSQYSGPGRSRHGGYGYVQEWPMGFYVGGSSIQPMNGLYERTDDFRRFMPHLMALLYRNSRTGWFMGYVDARQEGYQGKGGKGSEWIIIDPDWRDRFAHEGDTYLPGCCTRWEHLHRPDYFSVGELQKGTLVAMRATVEGLWEEGELATITRIDGSSDGDTPYSIMLEESGRTVHTQSWRIRVAARAAEGADGGLQKAGADDEDELPWQVVAIMSASSMADMKRQMWQHDDTVRRAIAGEGLPDPGQGATPGGEVPIDDAAKAHKEEGRYAECASAAADGAAAEPDPWRQAVLRTQSAHCYRRARDFAAAMAALDATLGDFPTFKEALWERALCYMDLARHSDAVRAFEALLRVDHSWPGIADWLVRAHAQTRRGGAGADIAGGFHFGDHVHARQDVQGFWRRGDRAEIIGLGTATAPLLAMFAWGKKVHALPLHFLPPERAALPPGTETAANFTDSTDYESADHYHVLRVPWDCTDKELKRAYRHASKVLHPDKVGGPAVAFQRVSAAYAVLSDVDARRRYDMGEGVRRHPDHDAPNLKEEVERRYFPEHFGWQAFGDPFEEKRRHLDKKREEEAQRLREQEEIEHRRQEQLAERAAEGPPDGAGSSHDAEL